MSDWGWVAFAYSIVYGALGAYVWSLAVRTRRARAEMNRR